MTILKRFLPNSSILIRGGVTLALLPALAILGFLMDRMWTEIPLLRVGVLLGVVFWIRAGRMEYGVIAILLTSGFIRFRLSTGTQSDVVASLLASLAIVGLWIVQPAYAKGSITLNNDHDRQRRVDRRQPPFVRFPMGLYLSRLASIEVVDHQGLVLEGGAPHELPGTPNERDHLPAIRAHPEDSARDASRTTEQLESLRLEIPAQDSLPFPGRGI